MNCSRSLLARVGYLLPALPILLSPLTSCADLPEATPESLGVSSSALTEMAAHVRSEGDDVRSMLVLRRGTLIFEWYSGGVTRDQNHNIYSITKSVVSALTGFALQNRDLPGLDATLEELFPDSDALEDDPVRAAITLEDLLTMRSGLPCSRANQPSGSERALFEKVQKAPDRLSLILNDLKAVGTPGEKFVYGNIEPQLVLSAIEEHSRTDALKFAERHLFDPLDFDHVEWSFPDQEDRLPGGYGLRLRAIDLAKLGQLYLQKGQWNGRQILDPRWIQASTTDQTGTGYGYYWWVDQDAGGYSARGVRGQRLEVFPELDLVFVITAELEPSRIQSLTSELSNRVRTAVQADAPLPDDSDSRKQLEAELEAAAQWTPASRSSQPEFRLPH